MPHRALAHTPAAAGALAQILQMSARISHISSRLRVTPVERANSTAPSEDDDQGRQPTEQDPVLGLNLTKEVSASAPVAAPSAEDLNNGHEPTDNESATFLSATAEPRTLAPLVVDLIDAKPEQEPHTTSPSEDALRAPSVPIAAAPGRELGRFDTGSAGMKR